MLAAMLVLLLMGAEDGFVRIHRCIVLWTIVTTIEKTRQRLPSHCEKYLMSCCPLASACYAAAAAAAATALTNMDTIRQSFLS